MADLPIDRPPSLHLVKQEDIPSDDDMGLNDPQNIAYVTLHAEDLPERFRERVAELEQMLLLTHQLVTIHTGTQVKRRMEEGVLPSDSSEESVWRRAAYRVRVMENYFADGVYPWLFSRGGSIHTQAVSVEKTRFHWELLSRWLAGIVLPRPIAASLEAIFLSIGETIQNTRDTSTNRTFLGLLQVFTYDEVRDDIRASYRGINYTLDQQVHEVVHRKSSQTLIEAAPTFIQADYAFNEHTWNAMKSEVEKYIIETGIGNIRDPPSVPV
ncbi:hypothetical protein BBO_09372 [Beauveria brongniartii RCEF 3172]|uniref:Uncharacterized protein n=1 Tax=Beauveria brongniartii RCEF 3172 TaxID=1081107 RepID=A0A166VSC4_9HYPO|nr:hypothetical protein BBO_09372 [Beauveria brongniartii RCEF 3172]